MSALNNQKINATREKEQAAVQQREQTRAAEIRGSQATTPKTNLNPIREKQQAAVQQRGQTRADEIRASASASETPANKPSATSVVANAAANAASKATSAGNAVVAAATAAGAAIIPANVDGFSAFKILAIFLIIAFIIFFIIQSGIIKKTYKRVNSVPSDENNTKIAQEQLATISPESDQLAAKRAGVFEAFTNWVSGKKEGFLSASDIASLPQVNLPAATQLPLAIPPMPTQKAQVVKSVTEAVGKSATQTQTQTQMPPEGERALLNFSVLGCRVAGYLGPKMNGVFKEEDAIRNALGRGCRLFIFDIDYLERAPSKPVLVCRDENNNLLSNNVGSIRKAAASLAAFSRKQRMAATDPIMIVLNVRRLPDKGPLARANINFMGEIAAELVPVQPYLLRSVPQGDVQQQRLEEVLFKLPIQTFENQMLLLTNLDTRGFRQVEDSAVIPPARNLDLLVHARIYTSENSALYYYQLPTANTASSALVQTYGYYDSIPETHYTTESDKTRNTWSMAMSAELDTPPSGGQLVKLVSQLGVQGIVIDPFADPAALADVLSDEWFGKKSYIAKPSELRYKEPSVIAIAPADKRIDANGGMLVTPNLG